MNEIVIGEWAPDGSNGPRLDKELSMLAGVLHAVVHAGASVNFILPFSLDDARAFWREKVLPGVGRGTRRVLLARLDEEEVVGTVQLQLEVPPNQNHRGEVTKLLVHPKARRHGVARALMMELEKVARSEGRTLLTLDTRSGDMAEPLYLSMGFARVGVIPRYSRNPFRPELEDTTIMYKELAVRT